MTILGQNSLPQKKLKNMPPPPPFNPPPLLSFWKQLRYASWFKRRPSLACCMWARSSSTNSFQNILEYCWKLSKKFGRCLNDGSLRPFASMMASMSHPKTSLFTSSMDKTTCTSIGQSILFVMYNFAMREMHQRPVENEIFTEISGIYSWDLWTNHLNFLIPMLPSLRLPLSDYYLYNLVQKFVPRLRKEIKSVVYQVLGGVSLHLGLLNSSNPCNGRLCTCKRERGRKVWQSPALLPECLPSQISIWTEECLEDLLAVLPFARFLGQQAAESALPTSKAMLLYFSEALWNRALIVVKKWRGGCCLHAAYGHGRLTTTRFKDGIVKGIRSV